MPPDTAWKKLKSRVIFQNAWLALRQDDVITPTGSEGQYTFVEARPFVVVVAFDKGKAMLIRQYRYPIKKVVTEFPAGGIEAGETLLAAAKRELREETGFTAEKWDFVGEFYELASVTRQKGHLFVAKGLRDTGSHAMHEDGIQGSIKVSLSELEALISNGEIIDALTPAAFYKAQLFLRQKKSVN